MSTSRSVAKTSSGEPASQPGPAEDATAFARREGQDVRLDVWVVPGARRTVVEGSRDGYLRVRLSAPAREGRANDELLRYLAERTGAGRAGVELVAGRRSRRKVVRVKGITLDVALARLSS